MCDPSITRSKTSRKITELVLRSRMTEAQILSRTRKCQDYFDAKINAVADVKHLSVEEVSMPIAWGFMVHSQVRKCDITLPRKSQKGQRKWVVIFIQNIFVIIFHVLVLLSKTLPSAVKLKLTRVIWILRKYLVSVQSISKLLSDCFVWTVHGFCLQTLWLSGCSYWQEIWTTSERGTILCGLKKSV